MNKTHIQKAEIFTYIKKIKIIMEISVIICYNLIVKN